MNDELKRVIYVSKHHDYSTENLKKITKSSRNNNPSKNISGCLICGKNSYLQLLEGPSVSVDELYQKIKTDRRHREIRNLGDEIITKRLFPSWSMRVDPFDSFMWLEELVAGDLTNLDRISAINIFTRISGEAKVG